MTVTRRITAGIIIFIMTFLLIFAIIPASEAQAETQTDTQEPFVVVLNPGHGPSSSGVGATQGDVKESVLNEQLTKKIYDELIAKGITVYITNPMTLYPLTPHIIKDKPATGVQYSFMDPAELLPAINTPWVFDSSITTKPTIAISVHHNSYGTYPNTANGYELYYSSTIPGETDSYGNVYEKSAVSVENSKTLANLIYAEFQKEEFYLAKRSVPVKDANVNSINKYSAVPSVLIEAGFMTNEADLEAIQIPENQSELAKRVADAVVAYRNIYIDDIEAPELESMEISGNPSYTAEFWAQAVNVTDASGVKDVEFRIWNESLGINKARWYDGVQNGSNWKVEASAEEFENTPGKYYIEAVATDIYGNRASIGMMVIDVMHLNELPPKMMDITMEQTVYDPEVTVDALVYDKDGIAGINVAVWSETNGQDDIKWFKATNKGNDTWGLTVDLAAAPYNLKADNYYFELHATDKLGYYDCIGETVITLGKDTDAPKADSVSIEMEKYDADFDAVVTGVSDKSGVKDVKFAVWTTANGQDDLKWYPAVKTEEGTYKVNVSALTHKNETGVYNIHVYATDKQNTNGCVGTATAVLDHIDKQAPKLISIDAPYVTTNTDISFDIYAKDERSGIKELKAAVWTQANGQDDLRWIKAQKTGDDKYTVSFDAAALFNKKADDYICHVYGTDTVGNYGFVGKTTITLKKETNKPYIESVVIENAQYSPDVTAKVIGAGDDSKVKEVRFAVWTTANGQDDLKWYPGIRQADGTYYVKFSAISHKNEAGLYNIHAYVYDIWGNQQGFPKKVELDHKDGKAPELISIDRSFTTTNTDISFDISAKDERSGIKNIKAAIWTKANGQDDIRWITAKHTEGDNYTVSFDAAALFNKKTDDYICHVYGYDNAGNSGYLGQLTITLKKETNKPYVQSVVIENAQYSPDVTAKVIGAGDDSKVKEVRFAVWTTANGQDDLKWYPGIRQADGTYYVKFSAISHKNEAGLYNIHAYVYDVWGNQQGFPKKVELDHKDGKAPELISIDRSFTTTNTDISFDISAKDERSGIKNIKAAIWTKANGQDDIRWITAKHVEGDNYTVSFDAAALYNKKTDDYICHVYGYDNAGNSGFLGQLTITLKSETNKPYIGSFEVAGSGLVPEFTAYAKYAGDDSKVKEVRFAVWTQANAQDDLKWYTAKQKGDGTWYCDLTALNHKNETGLYNIHAYIYDIWGNKQGYATTITLDHIDDKLPVASGFEDVLSQSAPEVSIDMTVRDAKSGTKEVKAAIWTQANGQDDLKWINAVKKDGDNWNLSFDIRKDFRTQKGLYIIHVYAKDNAGNYGCVRAVKLTINSDTAIPVAASYDIPQGKTIKTAFDIAAKGVSDASGVSNVRFAVWTTENGQDDLIWYNGIKEGSDWKIAFDINNHKSELGVYNVHIYGYDIWGNSGPMKSTAFEIVTEIPEGDYAIMGNTATTPAQMAAYYKAKKGASYYPAYYTEVGVDLERFCELYYEEARAEGVNAEVAFTQAMKETGWLQFGGIVPVEYFNFCGLGALNNNAAGQCEDFSQYGENETGIRMGIRAHIQHLKCYASTESLNNDVVDPRWDVVVRLYGRGFAPTVFGLEGTWAQGSGSEGYGPAIVKMVNSLLGY